MQFDKKTILFSGLVVVLLVSNLLTFVWLNGDKGQPDHQAQVTATNTGKLPQATDNDDSAQATSSSALSANLLEVVWNEWPAKVRAIGEVFDNTLFDQECKKIESEFVNTSNVCDRSYDAIKAYSVGSIKSGAYAGGELFLVAETPEGPAFRDNYFRVVRLGTSTIFLASSSESLEYSPLIKALVKTDVKNTIAGLEPPMEIQVPDSNYKLKRAEGFFSKYLLTDYKNPKKVFEYAPGKFVYHDEEYGCYLVGAPDGTVRQYDFALPFAQLATTTDQPPSSEAYKIKWLGATNFKNEFYNIKPVGGCGSTGCLDYVAFTQNSQAIISSLKAVAITEQGEKLYEFSDLTIKFNASKRQSGNPQDALTAKEYLEPIYKMYYPGYDDKLQKEKPRMSFEDFVKKHPVLFWIDPFGNYIQLTKVEFAPAVECGKPVIYLYPQKTTTVSVQVKPNGGITKSDPAYDNGWQVQAEPNGQLRNFANQKIYGSLFWEGAGLNYLAPKEGFVVAKNDVEKFMQEKLAKLGLNGKESADFMDFWLPRMQAAGYYFVSFVAQKEFDRLAPLTIEPKPDTVIRIFMDYKALAAPIKAKEPIIKTPIRRGFTVVEWGGAIRAQ